MKAGGRFTYSNLVSTLALIIATSTGGAYAASMITTSQIADGAVTTPKLRAQAVTSGKIRDAAVSRPKIAASAVNSAHVADGSLRGLDVASGSIGAADLALTAARPRAFAHVSDLGQVSNGHNISSSTVTRVIDPADDTPYEGVYCFAGLPFTPRTAAATASLLGSGPGTVTADVSPGGYCPPETDVSVRTFQVLGGSLVASNVSFNIVIWP